MIELRTLGSLSVRHAEDGRELSSVTTQRKRLALLVYLALARPRGFHGRETLLGLFWPDASPERARRALNQSVYVLRRALGPDVLAARGDDELGLGPNALRCDAVAFETALAEGRVADALGLYGGTFLQGMDVGDATGFERWLEDERARYRDAAVGAALRHADGLEEAGHVMEAVYWTRRAREWSPFDDAVVQALLERLERAGDRAGALREYEMYARSLAAELELEPDEETVAVMARIRGEGAPKAAPATETAVALERAAGTSPHNGGERRATAPTASSPVRRRMLVAAGFVVSMVLGVTGGRVMRHDPLPAARTAAERPRVLVAALTNRTGDAALDPLGRLAADWITQGLARSALVEAVPVAAVLRTTGTLALPQEAESAGLTALRVGREMRSALVLDGAIFPAGDSLTMSVQVRDSTGRVLRAITGVWLQTDDPLVGVRRLREQVVAALATLLDPRLNAWANAASQPPSFEAYQLYAEGLDAYLRMDFVQAALRFRGAAAGDTAFTAPLVWALRAHFNLGQYAAADSVAAMLAKRRDMLPPWDRAIADYFTADLRGDLAGAYHAMQRAVTIAPGSEWVYHLGVSALYVNRPREAVRHLTSIDPTVGWLRDWRPYWPMLLEAYHTARDFAGELEAIEQLAATGTDVRARRLRVLAGQGRAEEAIRLLGELLDERGRDGGAAALTIHVARELDAHGAPDVARAVLEEALPWLAAAPPGQQELQHGIVLYMLGRHAEARPLLAREHAREPRWETAGYLGFMAAAAGDTATARSHEQWFIDTNSPHFYGEATVWRAGIAAAAGDARRAVQILQEAYAEGLSQSAWLHVHPALVPLRGTAQFEALMAPAG